MLVGSIHEGHSAAFLAISVIVAVGFTNCSSSSDGSGIGGSTSVDGGITSGAAGRGLGSGGATSAGGVNGSVTASGGGNSVSGGSVGNSTSASDPSGGSAQGGVTSGGSNGSVGMGGLLGSGGVTATGGAIASGTAAGGKSGATSSTGVGGKPGSNTGGASAQVGVGGTSGISAAGGSVTSGGTKEGGQAGASSSFRLTSIKLADGATIPTSATCESTASSSQLPPLAWVSAPSGTQSFAMVFVDTTLIGATPPNTNGFHSAMWDIQATVNSLPEALPAGSPPAGIAGLETAKQKKAPNGNAWLGPCPNFPSTTRTKTDTYQFRLYALSVAALPSNTSSMTIQQIYNYLEALPPLGVAILSGTSNAAATTLK